jgi:hypothetical protein
MDILELNQSNTARHPWELARFEILAGIIDESLPSGNHSYHIIDMGCGDAWFSLQLLKKRNDLRITGIDPAYSESERQLKLSESKEERFSLYSSVESASPDLGSIQTSMVLLLDVVEHIEDDEEFLNWLSRLPGISDDTLLLISVPAYQRLFTGHDVFLKHYRRYSAASLHQLVKRTGWKRIRYGYFFSSLLPIRLLQKLWEKIFGETDQKGIGQWKNSTWATKMIKSGLLADYRISSIAAKAGWKLPGLSLYCLCKPVS